MYPAIPKFCFTASPQKTTCSIRDDLAPDALNITQGYFIHFCSANFSMRAAASSMSTVATYQSLLSIFATTSRSRFTIAATSGAATAGPAALATIADGDSSCPACGAALDGSGESAVCDAAMTSSGVGS